MRTHNTVISSPKGEKSCILIICLLFLNVSLCHAFGPTQTKRDRVREEIRPSAPSLGATYEKIHESFLRDDYAAVNRLADDYLERGSNQAQVNDVLYLQALSLVKLDRPAEARKKLKALENSFSGPDDKAAASASIADSFYYENDFLMARQMYEGTLEKYPQSSQTAYLRQKLLEIAPKPVPQGIYTVQVGSFSKQKNANGLVKKLLKQRYEAYMEKDETDRMYRVRVGHFDSREEAQALERRLKREGYPTKIFP